MKGIDIIIPVHKYDAEVSELLKRCLSSVQEMAKVNKTIEVNTDVFVVGPSTLPYEEIMNLVDWKEEFDSFNVIENESGEFDFCSQVNYVVTKSCNNDYFIVVEYDDMVTDKWVKMAVSYIEARPKCPMFLPLNEIYDIKNPTIPLHYMNEIAWSSSFTDKELGSLSVGILEDYYNFNITGAIVKKNDFIKAGRLKPSIKIAFGYELLLRLAHLYEEVFVIPKVGYFHFVNRNDSLTDEYRKTITSEEGMWWIKLATEEYQYIKDRKKVYSPDKQ